MAGGKYPGFPPDESMKREHRLLQYYESYLVKQLLWVLVSLLGILGYLVTVVVLLGGKDWI